MGLMPVHAAGEAGEHASDYVISSYIPTLKALYYTRQKKLPRFKGEKPNILAIAMPHTVGLNSLKVEKEIENIKPDPTTVLTEPTVGDVLKELNTCHIVHFACHAVSDESDPSAGGQFVGPSTNEKVEKLTIRQLAEVRLNRAQLAYLSACSTAENSSEDLLDEVIHIANAFQLIGFPHVIGTLWEANNKAAIKVAGAFYGLLMEKEGQNEGQNYHEIVAYALHEAVRKLRKERVKDVIGWAPFIHMGA